MNEFNLRKIEINSASELQRFHAQWIHCSDYGAEYMAQKAAFWNIYAENLRDPAVQILKESVLSLGGELCTNRDVLIHKAGRSAVVLMVTEKQLKQLIKRLKLQQFGLPQLAAELAELRENLTAPKIRLLPCAGGTLEVGKKPLIMGILNCTPDSFSDGGKWLDPEKAVEHALQMIADGADIIDIGGESTRPGSAPVSAKEEAERILPVITALRKKCDAPISVDSYKAEVAEQALKAGANIINDVWGFQYDHGEMAQVAAAFQCPVILMHNQKEAVYENLMAEITAYLRRSMEIALNAGCKKENLILDPGFGFGKDMEHNLLLTAKLKELRSLGCPVLMAASRKKTVGLVLDAPTEGRLPGDAAVTALSVLNGADIIRVHDVKEMAQVAKMAAAIKEREY